MTFPTIILGFLIASLPGVLLHFWKGGPIWRLFLYILVSWIGFWAGHFLGGYLKWTFGRYGPLNIGMGLLTCVLVLALGYWLSLVQVEKK